MICKVIGDLTGKLVQHGDCDHSGEMQQFFLGFSKCIQNWGLQNTPPFPLAKQLTHRQIQAIAWAQQREQVSHFSCAFLFQGFKETL